MPSNSLIRRNAADIIKQTLPQCFGIVALIISAYLILGALNVLAGMIFQTRIASSIASAIVSVAGTILITNPIFLGVGRWFWRITGGADDSLASVFYFYSTAGRFKRSISYAINIFLRVTIVGIVFSVPLYVQSYLDLDNLSGISGLSSLLASGIGALSALLSNVGALIVVWLSTKYFVAQYIMFNDETLTPGEAILISAKVMKRRVFRTIGFFLGFFGWLILCLLILPIMYVIPLIMMSGVLYARYTIADYNASLANGAAYSAPIS